MAFTVSDFQDLLRLLEAHPEWRAELRRQLVPEGLQELPALVRELAEAQLHTEQALSRLTARVDSLTARMEESSARMDTLTTRMEELTARVDSLAMRMEELTTRVDTLTLRVDDLTVRMDRLADIVTQLVGETTELKTTVRGLVDQMGKLTGDVTESRYRELAPAYFSRLARRLRVLDPGTLADRLDDAVEQGTLDETAREEILRADVVLSGRRREDQVDIYLLAEVSAGVGIHDVERAAERAAQLAKLGQPVIPIAAGGWINAEAADLARERGVWLRLDGSDAPPPLL